MACMRVLIGSRARSPPRSEGGRCLRALGFEIGVSLSSLHIASGRGERSDSPCALMRASIGAALNADVYEQICSLVHVQGQALEHDTLLGLGACQGDRRN
mmetsp:Transcript_28691/g.72515  ORF Transcript_28691/g.72515 Transcript_28691/m.72515 type:complete len:100 (+) Transcript_28691:574-873(+)